MFLYRLNEMGEVNLVILIDVRANLMLIVLRSKTVISNVIGEMSAIFHFAWSHEAMLNSSDGCYMAIF